jgi:ribonuclease D
MNKFYKKVPKEVILELPVKSFAGEIQLIENDSQVKSAVEYLNGFKFIGFDTETRPSFKKGERHQVALLQLATNEKAFLFRLDKIGLPDDVKNILSNPDIIKTGVAVHDDIKALQSHTDFKAESFLELQTYVNDFGIEDNGLKKLTSNILGFRISKKARLSNWEDESYSDDQKSYAATDAWVSFEIYKLLSESEGKFEIIS